MKRLMFFPVALLLLCCNGGGQKSTLEFVSVAELTVQAMLENVKPSDSLDSTWIANITLMNDLHQKVCMQVNAKRPESKAQLSASAQGSGTMMRMVSPCCPCGPECCGCNSYNYAASQEVSNLSLSLVSNDTIVIEPQKKENFGSLNVFRFDPQQITAGENYMMNISFASDRADIQLPLTFQGSNMKISNPRE